MECTGNLGSKTMKKTLLIFTVTLGMTFCFAESELDLLLDDDSLLEEITLEDLGETLDSSDLELDQMTTPDLPEAVLPSLFTETSQDSPAPENAEPTSASAPEELPDNVKVNVVNVTEVFYKLDFNPETNIYTRSQTQEAGPGDLIELVITATNSSDESVSDVEMVNTVPTGPIDLLTDSFETNLSQSLFRFSRNGEDFFPSDAEIEASMIRYVQWLIFDLAPNESLELKYRIRIHQ
jgi:uncharacterized repeat protein (TIGR01451 family)